MADVKWIKITTDIFDDEKILLIESLPDAYAIITVWFKLLCLAGKQNNSGVFMMGRIPYTDKMLATIFRMKESTVTMALKTFEDFNMVEIVDGVITIPNWEKHQSLDQLEQAKENTRKRVARHREKQKLLAQNITANECNAGVTLQVTQCNGDRKRIEEDKDKEEDIKKKSKKETTHTLFDSLLPNYNLSESLKQKLGEWLTYKAERNEQYKEQGLKSLLRQVENNQLAYGEQAVCALIDESMANMWKGIIFDRLKKSEKKPNVRKEIVPKWCNVNADEAMETAIQRAYKTAAEDEDLRERMETLKKQLGQ